MTLSPALAAFVTSHPTKKYDETAADTWTADSFFVGHCQICETICEAEVEITYQSINGGDFCNDNIVIGIAPFNPGGVVIAAESLYSPSCVIGPAEPVPSEVFNKRPAPAPSPVSTSPSGKNVKRIPISAWALQSLCATGGSFAIDWLVQDDTIVDSIKLIVHY